MLSEILSTIAIGLASYSIFLSNRAPRTDTINRRIPRAQRAKRPPKIVVNNTEKEVLIEENAKKELGWE